MKSLTDQIQPTNEYSIETNAIKSLKFDPEEAEKLVKVAESYNRIEEYKTVVRPWIHRDYARKPSINLLTQFALYKCMHGKCVFSTDSTELWNNHMQAHIELMDALAKKKNNFGRADRNELKKFRECCYCTRESKANHEALRHMDEEHRRSIFQCAHCFYRCIEMDNMVLHNEAHHPNQSKEILLCGNEREFEQKDESVLKEGPEYVTRIKCGQGEKKTSEVQLI